MTARAAEHVSSADREITAVRIFDAPREMVWRVWTDPRHIAQWWGPTGFTTTTREMKVKPGGRWIHVMHGPDGRDYPNDITYVEVVEPARIVYDHGPAPKFRTTVTFIERGNKTEVSVRMLFETAELRDGVARTYGAVEGLQQTLSRLAEHLTKPSLTLTRTFEASRELVYSAWTEGEHLAQWWGPHTFTNPVCEIDVRPGGAIRIDMRAADGTVFPMTGTFHEVVPSERLVFIASAMDGKLQTLNTITFEEAGRGTKLTVRAEVLVAAPEAKLALSGMQAGWSQSLERLEGVARTDEQTLVITRLFDAPRELVYDAWTNAEHLQRWFSPAALTVSDVKVDLRVGGKFQYCMRGPNGEEVWGVGTYRELDRPAKIVYTDSFADRDGNPVDPGRYGASAQHPKAMLVTITFTEVDGKTKITLRHEVPAWVPERTAMRQGWSEMLDRLAGVR